GSLKASAGGRAASPTWSVHEPVTATCLIDCHHVTPWKRVNSRACVRDIACQAWILFVTHAAEDLGCKRPSHRRNPCACWASGRTWQDRHGWPAQAGQSERRQATRAHHSAAHSE